MAKRQIVQGATSEILEVFIQDSTSTTGAGLTGLLHNSAGLTCYYHINTAASAVAVSLVTMTVGTFTSSGFKEVDSANMPGVYQICLPNAAYASGKSVSCLLKGATNMAPLPLEIEITQINVQNAGYAWDVVLASHVTAGTTGAALNSASAGTDPWGIPLPGAYAAGSAGFIVGTNLDQPVSDPGTLTAGERISVADALLTRDFASVSPQPSVTDRTMLQALRFMRNAWNIAANLLTVMKEDDTTTAWSSTVTVNSAAQPITGSDPA